MSFNFAISSDSAVRNSRRPLAPWEIHDVKFKGAEIREFNGKKDPNAHYKLLSIKYENEDGYFSVDLFFPKDGDDVRPEFDGANGGKVQMASSFETTMAIVKQTAQVLNPKGFEQMQKLSVKFKSFDDVAKTFIKVTILLLLDIKSLTLVKSHLLFDQIRICIILFLIMLFIII